MVYDYDKTMEGRPGNPIGKLVLKDGKYKLVLNK